MCTEYDRGTVRDLVQFLDKDRALGFQVLDDEAVVDDLVPEVDRPRAVANEEDAVFAQTGEGLQVAVALDDIYRAAYSADSCVRQRELPVGVGSAG